MKQLPFLTCQQSITGTPDGETPTAETKKPKNMKTHFLFNSALKDTIGISCNRPGGTIAKFITGQIPKNRIYLGTVRLLMSLVLILVMQGMAWGLDTGWLSPTSNPANNGVTNPINVFTLDNVRANYDNGGDNAQYGNFSITTIPAGAVINGIEVRVEGYRSSSNERNLTSSLSYNNGTNYTTPELQFPINVYTSGTEAYFSVGGSTSLWGRTWTIAELGNANFRIRLTSTNGGGTVFIDHLQVRVYYTVSTPPTISGFTPTSGCVGSSITINGTNFTGVTAADVKIGGTAVSSITTITGTQIVAVIGNGTTGKVTVTNLGGTATSSSTFTVNSAPTVTASTSAGTVNIGSSFTLTASASGGSGGGYTYSWKSPNNTTFTGNPLNIPSAVIATHNGTWTVTVTDGNGCTGTGTVSQVVVEICGYGNNTSANLTVAPCINIPSNAQQVSTTIGTHQYFVMNVIKGLTYQVYTTDNPTTSLKLTIYEEGNASGPVIAYSETNTGNPTSTNVNDVYLSFTSTLSGQVRVLINSRTSCSSSTVTNIATNVNVSGGNNTQDAQTAAGNNTWTGHIYDGTNVAILYNGNFANYLGYYSQAETFNETFGGLGADTYCFGPVTSNGTQRATVEDGTFSVRYRMNSTRKGLYIADIGSDDGSRLSVDGNLIYNSWLDQSYIARPRVLMNLTGNSSLLLDYYENGGGNQISFQTLTLVLANNLSTNNTQSVCLGNAGTAISGDAYGTLPSGITLSGTGYQWAYSTSSSGPWSDISGATSAAYTPSSASLPFNATGTYYIIRKAKLTSAANNIGVTNYTATNNSNAATYTVNALPTAGAITGGNAVCLVSTLSLSSNATGTGTLTYTWASSDITKATVSNTGVVTPVAAGTSNITYTVTDASTTCNAKSANFTVTVNALPTVSSATVSPNKVCVSGVVTFSATASAGTIKWYDAPTGGTEVTVLNPTISSTTTLYAEATSPQGCKSATRSAVTATVNQLPSAPTSISATPETICAGSSSSLNATSTGNTIRWYTVPLNGTSVGTSASGFNFPVTLPSTTIYYAEAFDATTGCVSATRTPVTVTVNPLPGTPTLVTAMPSPICAGSSSDMNATSDGNTIRWYTVSTGGTILGTSESGANFVVQPSTTTTYYAEAFSASGCSSASRKSVTVTVNQPSTLVLTSGVQSPTVCDGSAITDIVYTFGGSASGVYFLNIPAGLTPYVVGNKVTISGTPTATGEYTITTEGHTPPCEAATIKGTVTINEPSTIILADDEFDGTQNQTLCSGSSIDIVTYNFGGSATNAIVTNLPEGLTADVNDIDDPHTVTIYGTPTASGTYTITTTGETFPCNPATIQGSITLETLPNAGPIVGSVTPCEGTSETYSVTNVQGVTYNWTFPSGWTQTGGGNDNSVIVTVGSEPGVVEVQVMPKNTCGYGTPGILAITVRPLTAAAGTITGTATVCKGQTGVTYSVPDIANASGYVWTLPTGASIVSGDNTNTITVDYSSVAVSGNITVHGTNTCSEVGASSSYGVTVYTVPDQPGSIIGSTYLCVGSSQTYSVTNIDGVTYTWAFPEGWVQTDGGTTHSVTVTVGSGAGNVEVTPSNTCGNGIARTLVVAPTPAVPDQPSAIEGSASPCQSSSQTYQVTNFPGVTYAWILPSGWTGTSTTNSINVMVGPGSGIVQVTPSNACGNGTAQTLAITVDPLPSAAGTITGTPTVCKGQNAITYSVPDIEYASGYTWTLPTGASIASGTNSNSITVNYNPTTAASGNITVYGTNSCGNGPVSAIYPVVVNTIPGQPSAITGSTSLCEGSSQIYSVTNVPGVTYHWTFPSGWVQTAGVTSNSVTVTAGSGSGNVQVIPSTGACADGPARTLAVSITSPSTTGVNICQGGSGSLTSSTTCPNGTPTNTGSKNAGTGNDNNGIGTLSWLNPSNIISDNAINATVSVSNGGTVNATTHYLQGTNFNFAIPTNANINGIQVFINRYCSFNNSTDNVQDNVVSLIKAGIVTGIDNSIAGNWSTTTSTVANYGNGSDLWSTTWTPAQINASNFGVAVSTFINRTKGNTVTANVDNIQITVTYTIPGILNWYTASSGGTLIGSGSSFNPVGAPGSPLSNTNTPGTTKFYAECSNTPGCRAATDFVINPLPVITSTSEDQTITYGEPNPVLSATAAVGETVDWYDAATGDTKVATGTTTTTTTYTPTPTDAGVYTWFAEARNITTNCVSAARTPVSLTITAIPITLTATGPAKIYGNTLTTGTSTAFLLTSGNYLEGQSANSVTLTPDAAGLSATTAAGQPYVVTPSAATGTGGFVAGNYNITYLPFNGIVGTRPITLTATGPSKTYGTALTAGPGANFSLTSGSYSSGQLATSVTLTPDEAGLTATTAAGSAYIVIPSAATGTGGFSASNYDISYEPFTGTVSMKDITITATGPTKEYGTALTAGTSSTDFTQSGAIAGEEITSVTLTPDEAGLSSTTAGLTAYVVTPSAATGNGAFLESNYTFTYTDYHGTVTQKELTVTGATTSDKVYDGTTMATVTNGTLIGVINGDEVNLVQSGDFVSKNVGTGIAITSNCSIVGAVAGNYSLTQPILTAANITAKALTVSAVTITPKVYDGLSATGTVTVGTLSGLVETEKLVVTAIGIFSDPNVNTGITANITYTIGDGANGGLAANYSLADGTATGDITSKALTITGVTADNKPYDGTTTGKLSGTPAYFGLEHGETFPVTGTSSASFATATAGTGKTVIVTGYTAPNANYTLTQPSLTANIEAITLTITANNQSKCSGATFTFTGTEFTSSGLLDGDVISSVSFTSAGAAPGAAEGTYDIEPGDAAGTGLGNYAIDYVKGIMTVTANHWTGTTSKDWSVGSNWCAGVVPTSTANIVIPVTSNNPVINASTAVDCNNLTIETGASLTINSDAINSGSLIVKGTSSGEVTYNRWLNHDGTEYSRWYITSPPVKVTSGFDANAIKIHQDANAGNVYDFATYTESANDWAYVAAIPSDLVAGKGYLISLLPSSDGMIQFTGTLNYGDITPSVTTSTDKGWNAVGNPYTSAIKVVGPGSFLETNINNGKILSPDYAAIYVWNEDGTYTGNQQYYKAIGNSGYYTQPLTPDGDPFGCPNIQAGQGFLIKANTGGNLSITKAMQVHDTGLSLKSAKLSWPGITLLAESHGQTRSTVVAFNEMMTPGLDVTYDVGLLASDYFQVYTHLVGGGNAVDFTIQCLPDNQYNQLSVPVGVDLPEGGDLVFKASGNLLPQGLYPIIEDKELNMKTLLATETDSYAVTLAKNTTGIGRFYLSFGYITSVKPGDQQTRKYTASFMNNRITIFGSVDPGTKALVYDISGRKVGEYPLENLNRNEIMVSGFSQRVYLLKIENKNYSQVLKLVSVYTNF